MKKNPAYLLAAVAVLVTGADVFGQIQQVGHRKQCDGSYIGYQSSDWNQCDTCRPESRRDRRRQAKDCNPPSLGRGISTAWTDCRLFNQSYLGQCCATKAYPDTGWAPPARMPVNYDGAWYGAYQPQAWYGAPGGGFVANYPVVYEPTDTTQLGYYYHKVPTWQSRPGMLPPVPQPSQFHARVCPYGGSACGGPACGGPACNGAVYGSGGNCNSCNGGYSYAAPQFATPDGQHVVRQAPQRREGLLGGFRLASFSEMFD